MYVNLYRAAPEPSTLELRGAFDLLLHAAKDVNDRNADELYHLHGRGMRADLYKSYQDALHIINIAACDVGAQLKAMLGQNKEYMQSEALRSVK